MADQPTLNPQVISAVQTLNYRVTIADVATQTGLELAVAKQGILTLAAESEGHFQVAETGEMVYVFPQNFPDILKRKYFRLRWQERWEQVKRLLYYLVRISFGIVLIALIVLTTIAIVVAITSSSSDRNSRNSDNDGFSGFNIWFFPDFFRLLDPDYSRYRNHSRHSTSDMNFLEAVFSFLFGDGDPNSNLEEKRWQAIASSIRHHKGAVIAEQITPYLDELGTDYAKDYEEYMLPTLVRFNGNPEVTPEGQFVYHFPELQQMAETRTAQPLSTYLRETSWPFSRADSSQITLAGGLGVLLLVLALGLNLVTGGTGGLIGILAKLSLGYGIAYLLIPLIRYFWLQRRNVVIDGRNRDRQQRATALAQPDEARQQKLEYAQQFASESILGNEQIIYTTEQDLLPQEGDRQGKDWERRFNQSPSNL
jgi:hypothetical protein